MKTVLTLNVGSSSVKYSVFSGKKLVLTGEYDRILTKKHRFEAVVRILSALKGKRINAIAHRVVHGGDMKSTQRITPPLMRKLKKIADLAPLHDIPEIEVIDAFSRRLRVPQYAVFDTSFHSTMPAKARAYGLPYAFYEHGIKRYGFHGISNSSVSRGIRGRVIVCHIGNGCSVTAIRNGRSVDTSMGFTPLEGVVMGTRSGSIDPAIIPYLIRHHKGTIASISHLLNNKSGLLGLSGISHDMRDLLSDHSSRSEFAKDVFCYRFALQISSYLAALNGVDSIVFTGGVGQNSGVIRKKILDYLSFIGVKLDSDANRKNKKVISSKSSRVRVHVIPADEERMMALEAMRLLK